MKKLLIFLVALMMSPITAVALNDFTLVDNTEACEKGNDIFFSDTVYNYYFPCKKNSTILVKFDSTGSTKTVKKALEDENYSLDE